MSYRSLLVVAVLLAVIVAIPLLQGSDGDPRCPELEKQVAELEARLDALERRMPGTAPPKAPAAAKAPRQRPAPTTGNEIDPIYGQIDRLLALGDIDAAQALFAERKATGEQSSTINTLTREMAVVGQPIPSPLPIEKWFQGSSSVDLDHGTTLVLFWEAWCPYCRKEMPRIQEIYSTLKQDGLQVLGVTRVSKTATEDAVREVVSTNDVEFAVAKETGAFAEYFRVKGIPAAAVVRDGTIVWRGHPLRLTDNMIKSWL